jgi:hypothetical protein
MATAAIAAYVDNSRIRRDRRPKLGINPLFPTDMKAHSADVTTDRARENQETEELAANGRL